MPEQFDPVELIRRLNSLKIRYILIGRQAVVQYGAPLFSFDYDFWVHPDDRAKTCSTIESFGLITEIAVKAGTKGMFRYILTMPLKIP